MWMLSCPSSTQMGNNKKFDLFAPNYGCFTIAIHVLSIYFAGVPAVFVTIWAIVRAMLADTE